VLTCVSGTDSAFILTRPDAILVLREHAQAGGRFVAGHMEGRGHVSECWAITLSERSVEAAAYSGTRQTFFVASDLDGADAVAEVMDEEVPAA
jgi:hypothetical protein